MKIPATRAGTSTRGTSQGTSPAGSSRSPRSARSCAPPWATAPAALNASGDQSRQAPGASSAITAVLAIAAGRLSRKPGPGKLPTSSAPTRTRRSVTSSAARQPRESSATSVMRLASPGFTHGSGVGICASSTCSASARATSTPSREIRRVFIPVHRETAAGPLAGLARHPDHDLVREADQQRTGRADPAAMAADLLRARRGEDPDLPPAHLDPRDADRAEHLVHAVAGEVEGHGFRPGDHDLCAGGGGPARRPGVGCRDDPDGEQAEHERVADEQPARPVRPRCGGAARPRGLSRRGAWTTCQRRCSLVSSVAAMVDFGLWRREDTGTVRAGATAEACSVHLAPRRGE